MVKPIILLALWSVSLSVNAAGQGPKPPKGWKVAKPVAEAGCGRSKKLNLYWAKGDFNGDGQRDWAQLLTRESGRGLGVWVWFKGQKKPMLAETSYHTDGRHNVGIATIAPGTFTTSCSRRNACEPDEPAKLELTHDAINFFTCESSSRYVYWDAAARLFKSAWMTE